MNSFFKERTGSKEVIGMKIENPSISIIRNVAKTCMNVKAFHFSKFFNHIQLDAYEFERFSVDRDIFHCAIGEWHYYYTIDEFNIYWTEIKGIVKVKS